MKKRLPKAQKGLAKITKKIPKPKLPSRTVTKGRSGKMYETDSYAKEGLKQALKKRKVINSGDLKKVQKFLKNPNITKQDQLDFFKQALENNPKMKLYQYGGFTPQPLSRRKAYMASKDPRNRDINRGPEGMSTGKIIKGLTNKSRPTFDMTIQGAPTSPSREILDRELDKVRPRPGNKMGANPSYRSGGSIYHAKQFRRSRKH